MNRGIDSALSATIGRIYESIQDQRGLDAALAQLMPRAGARTAVVVGTDAGGDLAIAMHGARSDAFGEHVEEYRAELWRLDPTFAFFSAHPDARFFDTALHRGAAEHMADPFLPWNRRFTGSTHWMACHAARVPGGSFGVALHPGRDDQPFTDRERSDFRLLFEHLERAQWLATRPPRVEHAADPQLVVDPAGRVLAASAAAEALLAAHDGLVVRGGVLSAHDPRQARVLHRLIGSALNAVARGGLGGAMLVERPSGARPFAVLVDPLPDQAGLAAFARGALVRVIDPQAAAPAPAVTRWRALWGLTLAETRAAAALVEHHCDLRAAAAACGITYATMRTQLAALFAKTGCRGQPELMRLLTRVG